MKYSKILLKKCNVVKLALRGGGNASFSSMTVEAQHGCQLSQTHTWTMRVLRGGNFRRVQSLEEPR